jgi:hypothetical protein
LNQDLIKNHGKFNEITISNENGQKVLRPPEEQHLPPLKALAIPRCKENQSQSQ